jgi:hypothetical protein
LQFDYAQRTRRVHIGIDLFMNRHRFQLEILVLMIYESNSLSARLNLRFHREIFAKIMVLSDCCLGGAHAVTPTGHRCLRLRGGRSSNCRFTCAAGSRTQRKEVGLGPCKLKPTLPGRISWARLFKRVFDTDMQHCPNCGAAAPKIIAAILQLPCVHKQRL